MRLDAEKWRDRPGLAHLLTALGADRGLTRYVGGAVRDELLGVPVSDVDLATRLLPDEVVRRLEAAGIKAVPTGIDHGTITAVSSGQAVEVTTLRRDVSTDGRRATVAFTDDWKEDAARRDFTVNGLSADPFSGQIYDYFDGLADIVSRTVRFIGDPLERIAEDHLRILRFFRFHARFGGGPPDAAAVDACTARANDLMALSRERIADELLKLLGLPDPGPTVQLMIDRKILSPVLPEIGETGLAQLEDLKNIERECGLTADPIRRLAALLPADPEEGAAVGARLRLSKLQQKRLVFSLRRLPGSIYELAYRHGRDMATDRVALAGDWPAFDRILALRHLPQWTIPKLPIGGGALIQRGLTEGPIVARTLRAIEDAWIAAGFPTGQPFDIIVSRAVSSARES
ncbi:MAG: CCA tRNA nucleotidyltransferase [Sphingomicrobium sp.]